MSKWPTEIMRDNNETDELPPDLPSKIALCNNKQLYSPERSMGSGVPRKCNNNTSFVGPPRRKDVLPAASDASTSTTLEIRLVPSPRKYYHTTTLTPTKKRSPTASNVRAFETYPSLLAPGKVEPASTTSFKSFDSLQIDLRCEAKKLEESIHSLSNLEWLQINLGNEPNEASQERIIPTNTTNNTTPMNANFRNQAANKNNSNKLEEEGKISSSTNSKFADDNLMMFFPIAIFPEQLSRDLAIPSEKPESLLKSRKSVKTKNTSRPSKKPALRTKSMKKGESSAFHAKPHEMSFALAKLLGNACIIEEPNIVEEHPSRSKVSKKPHHKKPSNHKEKSPRVSLHHGKKVKDKALGVVSPIQEESKTTVSMELAIASELTITPDLAIAPELSITPELAVITPTSGSSDNPKSDPSARRNSCSSSTGIIHCQEDPNVFERFYISKERSMKDMFVMLTESERNCVALLRHHWEAEHEPMPKHMYLLFARFHQFDLRKCRRHISKFDKRCLYLRVTQLEPQLLTKTLFPIPGLTSIDGHDMFYMRPAYYFPELTRTQTIIDNLAYVMLTMVEKEDAAIHGIGFLADMNDWSMENFSFDYCLQFMRMLQGGVPAKVCLFLIVNPPSWFGIIWKIMKPMLHPAFRRNVKMIPEQKLSQFLAPGYHAFLPSDMTYGSLNPTHHVRDFIAYRKFVEANRGGD